VPTAFDDLVLCSAPARRAVAAILLPIAHVGRTAAGHLQVSGLRRERGEDGSHLTESE